MSLALEPRDLAPNWYAFALCVLKKSCESPEVAFSLLFGEKQEVDIETLVELKKSGMTYKDVGNIYGLTKDAVFRRIKRHKEGGK